MIFFLTKNPLLGFFEWSSIYIYILLVVIISGCFQGQHVKQCSRGHWGRLQVVSAALKRLLDKKDKNDMKDNLDNTKSVLQYSTIQAYSTIGKICKFCNVHWKSTKIMLLFETETLLRCESKPLPPWVKTPSCAASPNPWEQDFKPHHIHHI